jgi:hypothetical protein
MECPALSGYPILAVAAYFFGYSPLLDREVARDTFTQGASYVMHLRLHVLVYLLSYALLVAGFCVAIVSRVRHTTTWFPIEDRCINAVMDYDAAHGTFTLCMVWRERERTLAEVHQQE